MHRTPRYLWSRLSLSSYERRNPEAPWLARDAVRFLDGWLQPGDRCFEWGSGRSTRWIGERVARIQSVEHDAGWFEHVQALVSDLPGASVKLVSDDVNGYVDAIAHEGELDLVLVDGIHRDVAALASIERVRRGGVLVVDNVERYLPSASRAPEAIRTTWASEQWREFACRTAQWRRYWTSNGVFDTALFFRT